MSASQMPELPMWTVGKLPYGELYTADQMREYGQASRKRALADAMRECDKVSFAAHADADPGYVSSRAGGAVACRNKIKELFK